MSLPTRVSCRFWNLFCVVALLYLTILTVSAQTYSVSGTVVYYDNQAPAANRLVTFTVVGTSRPFRQTQNLRLSSTGTYTLSSLPAGTYQIYLRDQLPAPNTPRWLRTSASVTLTQNITQFNLTAIRGDITGNNKIDADDLTELLFGFGSVKGDGTGVYEQYPDGDIDGNNKIDVDDLTIIFSMKATELFSKISPFIRTTLLICSLPGTGELPG